MSKLSLEILNINNYSFEIEIPPRYSDVNIAAHLSNIAIIQLFEDAREKFLLEISGGQKVKHIMMIVSNKTDYISECFYPEPLKIFCRINKIGNSSLEIIQLATQNNEPKAATTIVLVNTIAGKPMPLPNWAQNNLYIPKA